MYKQIKEDIYEIDTTIEGDSNGSLKSFVIRDSESSLIIDTSYFSTDCRKLYFEAINSIGIDLKKAKVVLTHLHSDHSGLASDLANLGAEIFLGYNESKYFLRLNSDEYIDFIKLKYKQFGLENDPGMSIEEYPERKYRTRNNFEYRTVCSGQKFKAASYDLEVIDLRGHTPGHIGLLDRNKNILFSGDHILEKITPNIDYWDPEFKFLKEHRKSLRETVELNPSFLFTSHGNNITDCSAPAAEIIKRQDLRLQEIEKLVDDGFSTVLELASNMGWVKKFDGWANFPEVHKWMAVNQVMAFLKYMTDEKILNQDSVDGVLHFTVNQAKPC